MKPNNSKYYCRQCGREIPKKYKHGLCDKHYNQQLEHGMFLDDNPRCETDLNEFIIGNTYASMVLYDSFQEECDRLVMDAEDVDKIKDLRWNKRQSCITAKTVEGSVLLPNVILDCDSKIEFINGDCLDCRKENLKVIEKKSKVKKVNKRNKGKIEITSLGSSTIQVTGSCWSIEYDKNNGERGLILIENGICQGGTTAEDYNANKRMADYIPYDRAEFLLYTHPHGDHMLLSPASIPRGFKGRAIMTKEMRAIAEPLLLDGCFIHDRNVKELKEQGKKAEPLFNESDTYLFMNKIDVVNKYEIIKLNEEISIRLIDNSHVLGAVQIELYIKKPSNHVVKILYTGDLGSNLNFNFQPFLVKNDICKKADIMICESTYGNSSRGFTKQECIDERKDLMKELEDTIKTKSKCLIPSFSYSRSQCVMSMIYDHFKDSKENFQVIVDSRLTNEINNTYREILEDEDYEYWCEVLSWDRFKFITNYKDTDELSSVNDSIPRIILSSAGMMNAGHVKTWASRIMSDKNNKILFIGYAGQNTLANQIQNSKNPSIKIDGVECIRRCKIKIYKTFSSHIQQNELIDYFKQIAIGNKILLHHGDEDAKHELKEKATEELRKIGKTTKIVVVEKGTDTFKI